MRIALANLEFPESPQASVAAAEAAIAQAADAGASLICFPECFVPGYRALGAPVPGSRTDARACSSPRSIRRGPIHCCRGGCVR